MLGGGIVKAADAPPSSRDLGARLLAEEAGAFAGRFPDLLEPGVGLTPPTGFLADFGIAVPPCPLSLPLSPVPAVCGTAIGRGRDW